MLKGLHRLQANTVPFYLTLTDLGFHRYRGERCSLFSTGVERGLALLWKEATLTEQGFVLYMYAKE